MQRASLFLSFALLHSYDEYLPTPSGLWEELTALYLHARDNQLLEGKASGSGQREEFAQSAETTYKRIVLTSLVDPFHLSYGEIWKVYNTFAQYADLASVQPITEQDKPAGKFVIDPDEDQRPAYYAQAKDNVTAHCLLLDANPGVGGAQPPSSRVEIRGAPSGPRVGWADGAFSGFTAQAPHAS